MHAEASLGEFRRTRGTGQEHAHGRIEAICAEAGAAADYAEGLGAVSVHPLQTFT